MRRGGTYTHTHTEDGHGEWVRSRTPGQAEKPSDAQPPKKPKAEPKQPATADKKQSKDEPGVNDEN